MNKALRLIRVYHDMTLTQAAARVGLSKSYVSDLEKGHKKVTLEVLEKYATAFGLPMSSLMLFAERTESGDFAEKTPEFLHSAIKGRSYVTNASEHGPNAPTIKVDIRRFYPSIRAAAVFHFFRDHMQCAEDVAGILTKLLTVDGHLPTGSSASPILS